jgi:hypothetical protein
VKLPNFDTMGQITSVDGKPTITASSFFDSVQKWIRWASLNFITGGPSLTTVGAIPKVSAAGALDESALTDDGTAITHLRTIAGAVQPKYVVDSGGSTPTASFGRTIDAARADITVNLSYDGTNWNLEDTAQAGVVLVFSPTAGLRVFLAPAGANPVTPGLVGELTPAGVMDVTTGYKVGGVQVVAAQETDPGAVATAPVVNTSLTAQSADLVYSANEVQMLNEMKTTQANQNTSLLSLEAAVNDLITDRDNLRAVLLAHGLMA